MTTPVQTAAVGVINDRLQTGAFNPVTHGDIKTVADTLKGLNATDARAVIAELKSQGKLDQIASESVDGSILGLGGLSTTERAAFFNDMAGKLDGGSLATLTRAFGTVDRNHGAQYVEQLGKAVATHASPDAKVAFVDSLKGAVADQRTQFSTSFGSSTMVDGDADAVAIGEVLGSLRGAHAERAFESLNPAELKAVLTASVDTTSRTTSMGGATAMSLSWEAGSFSRIMTAGASIADARTKANLFEAGAVQMQTIDKVGNFQLGTAVVGRDAALSTMAVGMTQVVRSDVNGVMRDLTYSGDSKNGTAMAVYAKQMLNVNGQAAGGAARLGEFMAKLQLGNDLKGNAVTRLDTVTTVPGTNQTERQNAGALGYFVGTVYKAAEANSKDVKDQQEMVNAVLKTGLTVLDKAKVGGLPGQIAASVAKEWTMFAVRAAIADDGNGAAVKLENGALPVNPATGRLAVGDDVFSAFEDRLTATARTARP